MEEGCTPRTVLKPFSLLMQMLKFAMAQDLLTESPCDFCHPPKIQRKLVNALNREERTRMLELARVARPAPLAIAIEFKSFCKMHGFDCTFHDLRHTFATMMIANGTDVRTVASYFGHPNAAMTLNTYAEVDPQAKLAAVERVEESFDVDDSCYDTENPYGLAEPQGITLTFTVEQLEAMLAEARQREAS